MAEKNNDSTAVFHIFTKKLVIFTVKMKQKIRLDSTECFEAKPDTLRGQIAASKVPEKQKQKFVNRHKKF